MLTADVSKIKKVSCPTLPLFWKYFQKMGLSFSELAYFLRSKNNVNFTKTCFFEGLRNCAYICVNTLRHKCLFFVTKYLYSYTVIEKLDNFKIKNIRGP